MKKDDNKKPTLGQRIDGLYKLRERIRRIGLQLDELQQAYHVEEKALLASVQDDDLEGARGRVALASITRRDHLNVAPDGWPKLERWIYRHRALDLMQRRPSITAWRERTKAGQRIPGLVIFTDKLLSLTKR